MLLRIVIAMQPEPDRPSPPGCSTDQEATAPKTSAMATPIIVVLRLSLRTGGDGGRSEQARAHIPMLSGLMPKFRFPQSSLVYFQTVFAAITPRCW
jgi:hypothetical protein